GPSGFEGIDRGQGPRRIGLNAPVAVPKRLDQRRYDRSATHPRQSPLGSLTHEVVFEGLFMLRGGSQAFDEMTLAGGVDLLVRGPERPWVRDLDHLGPRIGQRVRRMELGLRLRIRMLARAGAARGWWSDGLRFGHRLGVDSRWGRGAPRRELTPPIGRCWPPGRRDPDRKRSWALRQRRGGTFDTRTDGADQC